MSNSHLGLDDFAQQAVQLHKDSFSGITALLFVALVLPKTNAEFEANRWLLDPELDHNEVDKLSSEGFR